MTTQITTPAHSGTSMAARSARLRRGGSATALWGSNDGFIRETQTADERCRAESAVSIAETARLRALDRRSSVGRVVFCPLYDPTSLRILTASPRADGLSAGIRSSDDDY